MKRKVLRSDSSEDAYCERIQSETVFLNCVLSIAMCVLFYDSLRTALFIMAFLIIFPRSMASLDMSVNFTWCV